MTLKSSLLSLGELLDLLKAPPKALVAARAGGGGARSLEADKFVDGGAESVGESGEDVTGSERVATLVVGDHALGELDLLGEVSLGEPCARAARRDGLRSLQRQVARTSFSAWTDRVGRASPADRGDTSAQWA